VVVFEGMKGAMGFFPVENQIVLRAMVRFILQRKNLLSQNFDSFKDGGPNGWIAVETAGNDVPRLGDQPHPLVS
jgi:hypothetical protein